MFGIYTQFGLSSNYSYNKNCRIPYCISLISDRANFAVSGLTSLNWIFPQNDKLKQSYVFIVFIAFDNFHLQTDFSTKCLQWSDMKTTWWSWVYCLYAYLWYRWVHKICNAVNQTDSFDQKFRFLAKVIMMHEAVYWGCRPSLIAFPFLQ